MCVYVCRQPTLLNLKSVLFSAVATLVEGGEAAPRAPHDMFHGGTRCWLVPCEHVALELETDAPSGSQRGSRTTEDKNVCGNKMYRCTTTSRPRECSTPAPLHHPNQPPSHLVGTVDGT